MQAFGHQPAGNKISKVRWENGQNFTDRELLFATGSWDEGKDNLLKLWSCEAPGVPRMDVKEYKAVEQTRIQHSGDVTDIHFLEDELLITASSFGSVNLFKIQKDQEAEKIEYTLEHRKTLPLHKYTTGGTASCTGIAIQPFSGNGGDIVSCGEDGKINLFSIDEESPRETIAADGMALNSIAWISSHLIATTTNGGQLKLYDIRDLRKPSAIYSDSSNPNVALTCMAIHPSQANKLCTGSANGHITTWDIRNQEIPESNPFSVHSSYGKIAFPSFKLLYLMDEVIDPAML
ncbi:hypothetical protein K7432_003736 [Basidiobolus ranarum]|uniref:Uncharacterized protein n=1 Tax=Basidiobolus ranarum TaxID=34480 RepID=A0ABR2WZF0_9FUNG